MSRSTPFHARWAWAAFAVIVAAVMAWTLSRSDDPPLAPVAAAPPAPITKAVAQRLVKPGKQLSKPKTAATAVAPKANKTPKTTYRPREVVVLFKADATKAERAELREQVGAVKREDLGGDAETLTLEKGASTKAAAAVLEGSDAVDAAERNVIVHATVAPNDPQYSGQWSLSSSFDTDIDAEEGWALTTSATTTVPVAVIDTGVDYNHPDLVNRIWNNPGETGSGKETNGLDDDANGYIDDYRGWDFAGNDNTPNSNAGPYTDGHGTHVAGIIAAQRNNSVGIAGVSDQARIMPVKVLSDDGSGDLANIYQGFKYAIAKGAKVVNASIGWYGTSNLLKQAVNSATNVSFVFAAGNDNLSLDTSTLYPCEIPGSHVTCVGSTDDQTGARSGYSNYSATEVDIVAPGSDVLSTLPTVVAASGYGRYSGTSMATPTVAGIVAVLRSNDPSLTPAGVTSRLKQGAEPLVSAGTAAGGRVNLQGAYQGWLPAATATGSASVSAGRVTYTAGAGGVNRVTLAGSATTYTVEDTGVSSLTPGAGCTTVTAIKVSCTSVTAATINTGDLGDTVTAQVALPVTVATSTGPATVTTGTGADTITTGADADVIRSTDGNDVISSGDGADLIFPGVGDDNVTAGAGADNVTYDNANTSAGNDTIDTGDGDDWAYDYEGNNSIHLGNGADFASYSTGVDHVWGDAGNDTLLAFVGADTVEGGDGDDWIWVDGGVGTVLTGGNGNDTVGYGEYDDDVQITLGGSTTNGAAGENHSIAADVENAMGGRGDDVIYGSNTANRLIGSAGDDNLYGNGGDDVIDQWIDSWGPVGHKFGNDTITGGGGYDTVEYESALGDGYAGRGDTYPVNVTLDGIANDGTPGTGEADNVKTDVENVTGTNGDDTLTGNGNANILIGGGGNDVLLGAGGFDTFVGDRPAGCATHCIDGTKDTVSYATAVSAVNVSLDGVANDGIVGEVENVPASVEKVIGSGFADTLTAGSYSATLVGGLGADTIRGGSANDVLITNDGVVDAVIECKGGTGDYVLRDSAETPNVDCESSATADTPNTTLTSGQVNGSTVNSGQTWTFTSDKAGSTFQCAAGADTSATFESCASGWVTNPRDHGTSRVYQIRAVSSTGVVDPTPVVISLTYDLQVPAPTITSGPANGSSVDVSTVQFAFSATGETVTYECRFDAGSWAPCTSPYTTPTLTYSEHEFWVRSKDAAGNRSYSFEPTVQFTRGSQILSVPAGVTTPATVSLTSDTTLGTALDWIHWRTINSSGVDRKNAAQRISTLSTVGPSGNTTGVSSGGSTWSWTDAIGGTPSASSDQGVIRYLLDGRGTKITLPALSSETRKLRVFVGVRGVTTVGTLKVNFEGQTPVTQTVAGTSTTAIVNKYFTIDYRPLAGSDTLNVEFTQTAGGNATGSGVVFYAAALY